jgi:hypothetical protein
VPGSLVALVLASLAYSHGGNAWASSLDESVGSAGRSVSMTGRKYYLTTRTHDGGAANAAGVCADGYHFASVWEILDPSHLWYDTDLGSDRPDSGAGPPTGLDGWIRTGYAGNTTATPGRGNCSSWSSAAPGDYGTYVSLPTDWTASTADIHVWVAATGDCSLRLPVWCVSDALRESVYLPLVMRG